MGFELFLTVAALNQKTSAARGGSFGWKSVVSDHLFHFSCFFPLCIDRDSRLDYNGVVESSREEGVRGDALH